MSFQKAKLVELVDFKPPKGAESFYYKVFDGVKLRVVIWNKKTQKGTILLQSGRTEFIEKYYEFMESQQIYLMKVG